MLRLGPCLGAPADPVLLATALARRLAGALSTAQRSPALGEDRAWPCQELASRRLEAPQKGAEEDGLNGESE